MVILPKERVVESVLKTGGGSIPSPVTEIGDGLLDALCSMDRAADLVPADVGVKVTVTVCSDPLAAMVRVVGETVNCEASVPVTVIPVTDSVAVPVLLMVNVFCDVAPIVAGSIVKDVDDTRITGVGATVPVPVTDTVVGLSAASCVMVSVVDLTSSLAGVNVTVTVWLCPAAMVGDVGDTVKTASLDVMLLTVRADPPVLVMVNVCVPDCPMVTLPKERVVGLTLMAGGCAVALPVRDTFDGLLDALCAIDRAADLVPADVGVKVTVTAWGDPLAAMVKVVGETVN